MTAEVALESFALTRWRVAHTRPRCEKKIGEFCGREAIEVCLPLFRSLKRYRGKKVEFNKPFFPGYLFFRANGHEAIKIRSHDQVARVLVPPDDAEFGAQLGEILRALETDREIRLAPEITTGQKVRVRYGPLRGMEGLVVRRSGVLEVLLRLDFIGQAAAVQVMADELELA